jgi:DEAD/DEAH box helicase domain-containing protein
VEHLDFQERKAYVKQVDVDYYTNAIRYTQVRVLEIAATESKSGVASTSGLAEMGRSGSDLRANDPVAFRRRPPQIAAATSQVETQENRQEWRCHCWSHGDVLVRSQVVGFKKIKFFTNENVGAGKLELPENEMHTTSYWITLERPLVESLPFSISERQSGMFGLLHALESVATLLLMCDGRDLGTAIGERPPSAGGTADGDEFTSRRMEEVVGAQAKEFFEPNLYLFDAYPGGIGFSEPLFHVHELLIRKTRELIQQCPCNDGCPSCVGPAGDLALRAKEAALAILERLCG